MGSCKILTMSGRKNQRDKIMEVRKQMKCTDEEGGKLVRPRIRARPRRALQRLTPPAHKAPEVDQICMYESQQ